jgi:asparagine synthase (glutamine-hydrolysing)
VAAFIAWGHACLARFNGAWAFALYDRDKGVVFAARDRFGIKPFYWLLTETYLVFGSELRQLTPLLPSVHANRPLVEDFLQTGALIGSEETFFQSLKSLLPGCYLNYEMHGDQITIERYYDLMGAVNAREHGAEDDSVQGLRALLEDSVRLRLYSESRVGTCLSGGLDSSSIALIAASQIKENARGDNIWAITAVSEDPERSEETFAGEVARTGSLEWIKVKPGYNEFCESANCCQRWLGTRKNHSGRPRFACKRSLCGLQERMASQFCWTGKALMDCSDALSCILRFVIHFCEKKAWLEC